MEKSRSSPLSFLFPWLSPRVLKFALIDNGIEVQLWRNNRLLSNWHPSQLRHVLPEPLTKWIDDNHIHEGPQPYPLIKQFWHYLLPITSKKLVIDSSVLAKLEEVSQPQDFALIWTINRSLVRIEGRYEGADGYLGMGWFHKGTKIWQLNSQPSNAIDLLLRKLIMPIERADFLLNSITPDLQQYLPIRTDFQLITNFTVQVIVSDAHMGGLILALECNYPQFLPTIQVPKQKVDVLLADQTVIRFPRQELTSVLTRLLQTGGSPVMIQGTGIPLFISEQLPVMRHFSQISDEMAAKITQANSVVSISTLKPTFTVIHSHKNGIGLYSTTATYQYQQHKLDMNALLAVYRQNQRYIQQYGVWFEWPYNAHGLSNTIQQHLATQILRPEEVMRFDIRRIADLADQSQIYTIQPDGTTPLERGQSVFEQLRHHGIPGGIVGEPKGLATMFVNACEKLLRANQIARILWIVPSNKKGLVTRTIHNSMIGSYVTVASLVTLRDEPALISRSWTLVIFQELDILLGGSLPSRALAQLNWLWALISITSKQARPSSLMHVLHLPEQYYEQFHTHYLFDLEKIYKGTMTGQRATGLNPIQSVSPIAPKKDEISYSSIFPPRTPVTQTPRIITVPFNQETKQKPEQPLVQLAASTQGGVRVNEVKRIEQKASRIPSIEQRVAILQQYWHLFDKIHERQKTGMKPLWGLVEDFRSFDFEHRFISNEPYQLQLYQQLLPSTILAEIQQLWGTCMLPRWPECIISEPFPHKLFAETFGLALKFWHGCALTAWFFCEGPSSRTDLAGLAEYYRKDVQALKEMGTPINERIFEDLARAESQLGQPQPFTQQVTTSHGHLGITATSTRIYGTQRKGFEKLRDIISFYRRQWAERYLVPYLEMRWEIEIREVAHAYKLSIDQKGIPPTAKQFTKDANAATNHWFGGNISELYRAIQEQSPLQPQRRTILPIDRVAFAFAVFNKLSRPENHSFKQKGSQTEHLANSQYYQLNKLAAFSFWYVQLEEAFGHTPTLQEFGSSKFGQASEALHGDINQAWKIFSSAIDAAKQTFPAPKVQYEPLKNVAASFKPETTREYAKAEFENRKAAPSSTIRPIVHLNQEIISKLQEETAQLQERLTFEDDEAQKQPSIPSISTSVPLAPVVRETPETAPEVDEDWQIVLQQWRPEHWEILKLLCLEQSVQLTTEERKDRHPISLIIDEINAPVDEQLGDLLIDPDTQTLSPHLRVMTENLVSWYYSSKGR